MDKGLVLSIDDDEDLQVVLTHYLEDDGYKVVTANTVKSAQEKVQTTKFDVILLDLKLPDGEGLTIIPELTRCTDGAIIVLSGKTDTTDKIVCLEMGADDYLTKPFEMRELTARIKAVMRRSEQDSGSTSSDKAEQEQIIFEDGLRLDRRQYQLFDKDDNSLDLTTGEFKLLEAMVLAPNRAISREHLFELTRDGNFEAYDRAIDIQVARIRKKIDEQLPDIEVIKTVRNVGYMFVGKIK